MHGFCTGIYHECPRWIIHASMDSRGWVVSTIVAEQFDSRAKHNLTEVSLLVVDP